MKFYRDKFNWNFLNKIEHSELTSIYQSYSNSIQFFKNGKVHNNKNAAYIADTGYKAFYLKNKIYGINNKFSKKSWRKFVKLQVFS